MHLVVLVTKMKTGRRLVILNNKMVYITTDSGNLEPGSEAWLRSMPPKGAKVQGRTFNCGRAQETTERAIDL